MTLPRSGRHGTVEVELQSTAVTMKMLPGQQATVVARQ